MKMILSHLIVDYEFKLADSTAQPFLIFGKVRLPSPFMTILVRKRTVRGDDERLTRRYALVDSQMKRSRADEAASLGIVVK